MGKHANPVRGGVVSNCYLTRSISLCRAFTSVICIFARRSTGSSESRSTLRTKTSGWWPAGASEQQEQHELKEESGFVGTRVSGTKGAQGGEREREQRRKETDERWRGRQRKKSRRSPRDVILFNDNGAAR